MEKKHIVKPSSNSRATLCRRCNNVLTTRNDVTYSCEKCLKKGMIKDLYKTEDLNGKDELSEEWKKLTGDK